MEVGIRQLRDELSQWIERAKMGHEVTVTDHGTPVARLVPVAVPSGLQRLMDQGLVTPARSPKRPSEAFPKRIKIKGGIQDLIKEQRR